MADPVLLEVKDGIARITFNRPEANNALNLPLARAFARIVEEIEDDPAVRAVLLTGSGRMFSAGGDLRAMRGAPERGAFLAELVGAAHEGIRRFARLSKPVVCAVQGAAAGGGLSFVLLSDVVVAARSAKFTTAYTSVGLTPDCGQSWLLPRVVGLGRALGLTLLPRPVGAEEAQSLGIASLVVDDAQVLAEAVAIARKLASGPAHALGAARALLREGSLEGFEAQLDREARTIAAMAATPETGALIEGFFAAGRA